MDTEEQRLTLNWIDEANAVISDIERFVKSIKIAQNYESNCMRIFFDIETLEHQKIVVCMSSRGFTVYSSGTDNKDTTNDSTYDGSDRYRGYDLTDSDKVYETIYALLDDSSQGYRQAFALALAEKICSIERR